MVKIIIRDIILSLLEQNRYRIITRGESVGYFNVWLDMNEKPKTCNDCIYYFSEVRGNNKGIECECDLLGESWIAEDYEGELCMIEDFMKRCPIELNSDWMVCHKKGEDMSLTEFADKALKGLEVDKDEIYGTLAYDSIMELVKCFEKQGHSAMSAWYVATMFYGIIDKYAHREE